MNLENLKSGQRFGPYPIDLTHPEADAYIAATGANSEPHDFQGGVHPLQLDAYVLSRLIAELGIVEDRIETVHAGQQMTVHRPVVAETSVTANPVLKSCSNRRGRLWAIFETDFIDGNGNAVAESSSTIILMP